VLSCHQAQPLRKEKIKSSVVGPSVLFVFGTFAPPNNKIRDKRKSNFIFFQYECFF
jgi:hypothetical protein